MTEDSGVPPRRLARGQEGRLITGVCAGLARYTRIDAIVFRVAFALLVLATGIGIMLYVGAFLLMAAPDEGPSKIEQLSRRLFDGDTVLALLGAGLAAGTVLGVARGLGTGDGLAVAVVFALALFTARARGAALVQVARTLPERVKGRPLSSWTPPSPPNPPNPPSSGGSGVPVSEGMVDLARLTSRMAPFHTGEPYRPSGPSGAPDPSGIPDPSGAADPFGTRDPIGTPEPSSTAEPSTTREPSGTPESSSTGGPSSTADPFGRRWPFHPAAPTAPEAPAARPASPPYVRPRTAPSYRRSRLGALTLPAALLTGGVLYAAGPHRLGFDRIQVILAGALAVVAAGLFLGSWFGRSRLLVVFGAIMCLTLASTSIAADPAVARRTHVMTWGPSDTVGAEQSHSVFIGEGTVDLTRVPLAPGGRIRVNAKVTLGVLAVKVPATARVEVDGQAFFGDITVDHRIASGPRARVRRVLEPVGPVHGAVPVIELRIRSTVGDMEVTRVPA